MVSTHPAAQAVAPFTGDFPLALLRQQPSSAARTGAQHAPHLQYTLLRAILLVPVVLGEVEGKVSCACDPELPQVSCFCLSAQMRNSGTAFLTGFSRGHRYLGVYGGSVRWGCTVGVRECQDEGMG